MKGVRKDLLLIPLRIGLIVQSFILIYNIAMNMALVADMALNLQHSLTLIYNIYIFLYVYIRLDLVLRCS